MMDSKSREELDRITMLSPEELGDKNHREDVDFLRARRAYLRPEQSKVFEDFLKDAKPMSAEELAAFKKENERALAEAEREAAKEARKTKTVKESQNPIDNPVEEPEEEANEEELDSKPEKGKDKARK